MSTNFSGLWPAVFTPLDKNGEPALGELEKLIELFISQDLDGLYILGSTGQGVLLTEEQRKKATTVVSRVNAGRLPLMVQVGALTTDESIRLAKHAESCGVDGISSVGPIYYFPSANMALEHYRTIAASTDLPFFPYQLGDHSIPGETLSFIEKLFKIPNITGMKLTTNQLLDISAIHNYAGDRLKLFSGSDELFCHASLCGTVGAIGSFYNIWGSQCKTVLNAFQNGNFTLARDFMLTFQQVITLVLPNAWTFFRKAMLLKYQIDIGQTRAPLGNTNMEWKDDEAMAICERLEAAAVIQ